jgi:hypothetical protein
MKFGFTQRQIAIAAVAALGASALSTAPSAAPAAGRTAGKYVAGDFHNHTTCSDGSISMQKLVNKATATWGLDWFVQAGHGGNGNRNCTLVEDASLATPAYPLKLDASGNVMGPSTTWQQSLPVINPKGVAVTGTIPSTGPLGSSQGSTVGTNPPHGVMWRWQSIQEFQYPLMEYLSVNKNVPLFMGMESVVAGHEHTSMSVITGQMPATIDGGNTSASSYTPLGNANALAQWSYCFDRADTDTSRGNVLGSTTGNNWNCSVTGSLNASDPNWNATAQKLTNNSGVAGHNKTLEAIKWMAENHGTGSYYVPAHLERAGPFNTAGSNGFNIEHLRDFNNTAPAIAFGFETQPGHGASANRGEYQVKRNNFGAAGNFDIGNGTKVNVDSVGGTTYGGTGVYGAQVGGVWDSLLGEGRNFWFFASSDWHNRGSFGPDDRRSTQDFQPGEYQRNYALVRNGADKLRPQSIVDGLRTGNNFASSGQLIDRLAFVACASYPGIGARSNASVEAIAVAAATSNSSPDAAGCSTMGEKLAVRPGAEIVVAVVVRDPAGTNHSPYTFANPSLKQVGITQPLNMPVLDHIDVVRGLVLSTPKKPTDADYAGEWPRNTNWLSTSGTTAGLSAVPAAAKNTTASVIKTFNANAGGWTTVSAADNTAFLKMSFRIPAVQASQYVRLRGSNLPAAVPFETDAAGNPLADLFTNAGDTTKLSIPCTTPHSASSQFDGCPDHLATATGSSPIAGQKAVSFDVAAWADLWFYSNPIYIEVSGSTTVAGVK